VYSLNKKHCSVPSIHIAQLQNDYKPKGDNQWHCPKRLHLSSFPLTRKKETFESSVILIGFFLWTKTLCKHYSVQRNDIQKL